MYCSKCGCEISENATFCGNCGNQIKKDIKPKKEFGLPKNFETILNFDFKKVLNKIIAYFTHFYVDYDSKLFKFATLIFLAMGIGAPLYVLIISFLRLDIYSLFPGASTVFEFLLYAVLFGIFAIPILKSKSKETIKKSNFLRIFWIVTFVLNVAVFFAGIKLYQYILYPNFASRIIEMLAIISTVLLLYKNKPKYPIVLVLSVLSFALSKSEFWFINLDIGLYKIWKTWDYLIKIFKMSSLGYIALSLILFVLVYVFPRKLSKWLVYVPSLLIISLRIIDLVKNFSFDDTIRLVIDICLVILVILFALSCSRAIEYKYTVENLEKSKKSVLKVSIVSVSTILIITVTYLLVSAIVCSKQINSGISKWKNQITEATLNSSEQWNSMNNDIFKYSSTKLVSQFVDEYNLYSTLEENRLTMERISICYSAYKSGNVNDEIIKDYSYINVDDSWSDDSILSVYYDKYLEMQPKIENVSVSARVDVDKGQIKVTVSNKNKMPITKCTVDCKFTIGFVESGYYTNNTEYGRGTKTITVENIDGNSEKTETISFNPDDYYESYGSYIIAFLMDKSASIISIE